MFRSGRITPTVFQFWGESFLTNNVNAPCRQWHTTRHRQCIKQPKAGILKGESAWRLHMTIDDVSQRTAFHQIDCDCRMFHDRACQCVNQRFLNFRHGETRCSNQAHNRNVDKACLIYS